MYRERLWPAPWVWGLSFGVIGMLAWAMGFALGPAWGVAVLGAGALAAIVIIAITVPRVSVDETHLVAGHARLPRSAVARVVVHEGRAMDAAVRHPRVATFLMVRPWSARTGVEITLDDSRDPHGAWLVTSRRPEALREALLAPHFDEPHARLTSDKEE